MVKYKERSTKNKEIKGVWSICIEIQMVKRLIKLKNNCYKKMQ